VNSRWIGWSVVVCTAAATAAYAGTSRRSTSRTLVAKAEPRRAKERDRDKDPDKDSDNAAAVERSANKQKPRAKKAKKPKVAPGTPPADIPPLTDDPLLARGDRIDGHGVKGMVAFTFDDGPNPETTPHVIDALQKYDVPATFFIVTRRLVGRLAAQNRTMLAKELAGGFMVGSHSVSHTNLKDLSPRAVARELDQSVRVLAKQADRPIGLFRAPFGALDERGRDLLKKRGLTEVKWSIDTIDWHERDGEKLRRRAIATILRQEGGVVLMHDVKEVTARSLALLLDDLEAANCQRLADGNEPILPVSLHYWLRDDGKSREIPEEVKQRTQAYRDALPARCAARPAPEADPDPALAAAEPARAPAHGAKTGRARRSRR
jgi:peptidoglycan/xylan/chitin deacetylase (PgdA/CDA1 family)